MGTPADHPGFKQLLRTWNEKLKESEFRDAEVMVRGELVLRTPGGARRYERMDEISREARAQFFRRLSELVATAKFRTELERQILTLYAEGISQLAIQRRLNIKGHRCKVYRPIYRWLRRWGIKE